MHFIVVRFETKPEWSDRWLDLVADFTAATRAEPGNLWFDWSRSADNPHEFVLLEAFTEEGAAAHAASPHFQEGLAAMRPAVARTPRIISRQLEGDDWDPMGELQIDE